MTTTTAYAPAYARKLPAVVIDVQPAPKARQSRKAEPKRKKGYWYCQTRRRYYQTIAGRQIPVTDPCEPTPENEAIAARKVAATKLSNDPNPLLSVGDLAEKFLAARKTGRKPLRSKTHKTVTFVLSQFCKSFGKVRVAALKGKHIEKWADDHSAKWSQSYINTILGWVRSMFIWGVRNEETTNNPMAGVEVGECGRRELPDNIAEILERIADVAANGKFRNRRFADWLNALRWSGARPNEICNLTVEMVTDHGNFISATLPAHLVKTGTIRTVYFFFPQALALIRRLVEQRKTGLLFVSRRGNPITPHAANCVLKRCRKQAGIKGMEGKAVAYACRHVFITAAIVAKIDVPTIAKCVGNSPEVIYRHYSHLLHSHIANSFLSSGMFASKAG